MRGQKCRFRPFGLLSPFGSDETLELPQHARQRKMPLNALTGRAVLREAAVEDFEAGLRKHPITGEMIQGKAKPASVTVRVRALKKLKDLAN